MSMKSDSSGDPRSKLILILLILNTLLLLVIFFRVSRWSPKPAGKEAPASQEAAVQPREQPAVSEEQPPVTGEAETISPAEVTRPIKVEILNGCGTPGIAKKSADFLRSKGYDIRDFKNAKSSDYTSTVIYVRGIGRVYGETLAGTIGLPLERVQIQRDPTLVDVDVTLILGADYKQYNLFK